ncbi:FtsX-like permease family protein [Bacillus thuringiensis]|uniref:FtsX-like permease family protein n=1 Tax=Bacillus thuringiensis TaxID=1428 RepID=UPI000CD82AF6|nr:FtsX-like permease family protein [Bacillus thuringiensis]QFQ28854.1 FtsX-like permease family protein [Bacillus thuringiensis]
MKKLIFLLFTITFIVISFLSIKQFEYIQFQSFNNYSTGEKWNIIVENGNPQKSKFENFRLLEQMARQASVNIQRISYEKDNNNKEKIVHYVAFFEKDKYFENIKLKAGKFLNINSDQNDYISTTKTHTKHQVGQLEIFHTFDPIEIRPMIAAEKTKDIKGAYTLNGKMNAEKLKKIAFENGFTVRISKEQAQSSITPYPYQDMMYKASFILCLLIALAMLYDVINNYKEIAVRYLLGYNFWQIGVYLFRKYIKVFLSSLSMGFLGLLVYLYFYNEFQQLFPFLSFWLSNIIPFILIISLIFIVTWLGTKTINISQMIKNKKPIKLLFYINIIIRFILAIFLILGLQQGISSFLGLKNTVDKEKKWALLKDYSYLGIVSESEPGILKSQNEEEKRHFQQLYKELESQGAIYISPSSYYMDIPEIPVPLNPWGMDGKRVEINKNYLSVNPIIGIDNKQLEIPDPSNSNEITVIVPTKFEKYESDIKRTLEKDYTGIYNATDSTPPSVNILYVKNDQSYFTFSTNMAEKNNYEITDPIAIIVNSQFDPRTLARSMSMGYGYYTKNSGDEDHFRLTRDTLKKYNVDEIWQPISVAYSNVELKIANNKELLQLATVYCSLFVILVAVLLFFSSIYYLEMNKKSLALQWIFGYTFFEKHYLAYLVILVFWNFTFASCFFITSKTLLLTKITIGLTIFDIILISIILSIKEYKITKQILIEK